MIPRFTWTSNIEFFAVFNLVSRKGKEREDPENEVALSLVPNNTTSALATAYFSERYYWF